MSRTRIKICGIRDEKTALIAAEHGADAIGFVFVATSPRHVEPERALEISQFLPPFITTVGLTVNARIDEFDEMVEHGGLDYAQLHGAESEPLVRDCGCVARVIKAIRFDADTIEADLIKWSRIDEIEALLIDGSDGGKGEAFDWNRLAEVADNAKLPLILAGGLSPENVAEAIRIVRPWAVDVSSGVESEKGVKDPARIRAFCQAVRDADASLG
ncbi:MAG: phosphoribosylanthranilate isomerase [Phycisphaerales bacterium]